MRRIVLLTVGVLLALSVGTPSVSAQGFSVQIGPGGVAVGNPYRDGQRRDYYDRREYRSERRVYREPRCRTRYIQDQYGSRRVTRCN